MPSISLPSEAGLTAALAAGVRVSDALIAAMQATPQAAPDALTREIQQIIAAGALRQRRATLASWRITISRSGEHRYGLTSALYPSRWALARQLPLRKTGRRRSIFATGVTKASPRQRRRKGG